VPAHRNRGKDFVGIHTHLRDGSVMRLLDRNENSDRGRFMFNEISSRRNFPLESLKRLSDSEGNN